MALPRGSLASGTGATALVLSILGGATLLVALPMAIPSGTGWLLAAACAPDTVRVRRSASSTTRETRLSEGALRPWVPRCW